MVKRERIYRRTDSGSKAWNTNTPALSDEHRRILGLLENGTHSDVLRTMLREHADIPRLAELEAKGLIVTEAAAEAHDLDFTGGFALAKPA